MTFLRQSWPVLWLALLGGALGVIVVISAHVDPQGGLVPVLRWAGLVAGYLLLALAVLRVPYR